MKKTLTRLALGLTFSAASLGAFAQGVLRVSAIPDEAPTELQRKFTPLGDYLKKETGMDVQFTPVTDYAAVVEGLATNKIDLAWLGGFTYVQARIRTNGVRDGRYIKTLRNEGYLFSATVMRVESDVAHAPAMTCIA